MKQPIIVILVILLAIGLSAVAKPGTPDPALDGIQKTLTAHEAAIGTLTTRVSALEGSGATAGNQNSQLEGLVILRTEGSGSTSTDTFSASGPVKISWKYTGDSSFMIDIKDLSTDNSESVVMAYGAATGQKLLNLPKSDKYFLDIKSLVGNYVIIVEKQ